MNAKQDILFSRISGKLLIGPMPQTVRSLARLKGIGVNVILDLTDEPQGVTDAQIMRAGLSITHMQTDDFDEESGCGAAIASKDLFHAVALIGDLVAGGVTVFVGCTDGTTRCVLVATAYLCMIEEMQPFDAIAKIKHRHPCANPDLNQIAVLCRDLNARKRVLAKKAAKSPETANAPLTVADRALALAESQWRVVRMDHGGGWATIVLWDFTGNPRLGLFSDADGMAHWTMYYGIELVGHDIRWITETDFTMLKNARDFWKAAQKFI